MHVFSLSRMALLRGLDKFSYFSKGSFNPSGVLLTWFAWLAPAWWTGSDRTKFHWHDKISYQVLFNFPTRREIPYASAQPDCLAKNLSILC